MIMTADDRRKMDGFARASRRLASLKPRGVSLASGCLVNIGDLSPDGRLPLLITPASDDVDAIEWAKSDREVIERNLAKAGALLFRGFDIDGAAEFEQFATVICPELYGNYGD